MADAASPYAPGTVGDEPAVPRAPGRPAMFVVAAFVMSLVGPGAVWLTWRRMLTFSGIAADHTLWLEILGLAPVALAVIWGLLSDRWPIMDARREGHLFCAAVLAALSWLALLILPHGGAGALAGCGIVAAHSIAGVAIGGALAEIGRRDGTTGRLGAAWTAAVAAAQLVGGALRTPVVPMTTAIGVIVGLAAMVAISMIVSLGTDPTPAPVTATRTSLREHLRTPALWKTAAVVLLATLGRVPNAAIAGGTWPWPLAEISLMGWLAGACIYAFACRRLPFARALRLALVLNVVATIALMRASEQSRPVLLIMVAALGLTEGFKLAALDNLILRASPPRHEAFICALLWALAPVAWAVSHLITDAFHSSSSVPTTVAVIAAAAAMFASGLLPASLLSAREGERNPA